MLLEVDRPMLESRGLVENVSGRKMPRKEVY
jgi:hypothetical protein